MTENSDDKLFCEVGVDLGILNQDQVAKALEAQKIDRAVGVDNKRIGAYFLESNILTRDQIGQILKLQERYARSEASNILSKPIHEVPPNSNAQQHSTSKAFDEVYCSSCGKTIKVQAEICPFCGVRQSNRSAQPDVAKKTSGNQKSKGSYQALAFFLGGLGIHNFYIGNNTRAVAQLLLTLLSGGALSPIVWIWAVVECCIVTTDNDGVPLA